MTTQSNSVSVDYAVEGERSAVAVARGLTTLIGVAAYDGEEYYAPAAQAAELLQRFGDRPRVYHDALFARAIEMRYGLPPAAQFDDTRVMLRLTDENQSYEALLPEDENPPPRPGATGHGTASWTSQPRDLSLQRARITAFLAEDQSQEIDRQSLTAVYRDFELPVIEPTVRMMMRGIAVDHVALQAILNDRANRLELARGELIATYGVNPNSEEAIRDLLFRQLGLPVNNNTRRGRPSTDDTSLRRLRDLHPVVPLIQEFRACRAVGYAGGDLLQHASSRVHANIDPLGAVTGRYACESPGLQSLPAALRPALCASDGMTLVEVDISQAELRILAHFSREPALVNAFASGDIDLHQRTAALALGISENEVTPQQRNEVGKRVNFAVIYGETEIGLSRDLGVLACVALDFINRYFQAHPWVRAWRDHTICQARALGYVTTLYGRRRRLPELHSSNRHETSHAERQAVNSVIQGTGADLIKLAIARLFRQLPSGCHILLTCHDSILLEAPEGMAVEIGALAKRLVEEPLAGFTVPIRATVGYGRTWAECRNSATEGGAGQTEAWSEAEVEV